MTAIARLLATKKRSFYTLFPCWTVRTMLPSKETGLPLGLQTVTSSPSGSILSRNRWGSSNSVMKLESAPLSRTFAKRRIFLVVMQMFVETFYLLSARINMASGSLYRLIHCQGRWMYPTPFGLEHILFWWGEFDGYKGRRLRNNLFTSWPKFLKNPLASFSNRPDGFRRSSSNFPPSSSNTALRVRYSLLLFLGQAFVVLIYVSHMEQLLRTLRGYVIPYVTSVVDDLLHTFVDTIYPKTTRVGCPTRVVLG